MCSKALKKEIGVYKLVIVMGMVIMDGADSVEEGKEKESRSARERRLLKIGNRGNKYVDMCGSGEMICVRLCECVCVCSCVCFIHVNIEKHLCSDFASLIMEAKCTVVAECVYIRLDTLT